MVSVRQQRTEEVAEALKIPAQVALKLRKQKAAAVEAVKMKVQLAPMKKRKKKKQRKRKTKGEAPELDNIRYRLYLKLNLRTGNNCFRSLFFM